MADADEDNVRSLSQQGGETDLSDETQDFRFLANFSQTPDQAKIPKRGEKDFEPHGTTHQLDVLAASRAAMHAALSTTRVHTPKGHIIGYWHQESNMTSIAGPKGPLFKSMGKADRTGRVWLLPEETLYLVERGNLDVRWPRLREETDGSSLEGGEGEGETDADDEGDWDLPMSLQAAYAAILGREAEKGGALTLERYEVYAGLKRAGYAVLRAPSWDGGDVGGADAGSVDGKEVEVRQRFGAGGLVGWLAEMLMGIVGSKKRDPLPLGPLVTPGLYRSYDDIYRLLSLIPLHDPTLPSSEKTTSTTTTSSQTSSPASAPQPAALALTYHLHKPSPSFKKSAPGPPDFLICVLNARTDGFPSLAALDALLATTPYSPPPGVPQSGSGSTPTSASTTAASATSKKGNTQQGQGQSPSPSQPAPAAASTRPNQSQPQSQTPGRGRGPGGKGAIYARLRHGYRHVILAVVDQGVVSYLRVAEAGFGRERLWQGLGGGYGYLSGPGAAGGGGGGGRGGGKGGGRGGRGGGGGRGGRGARGGKGR
ncbi:MAG: hypothetical protein M1819_001487 [Sarea resinae]|nr:MAG: hypothetical protein M1819_001487 [Sarea resinae]